MKTFRIMLALLLLTVVGTSYAESIYVAPVTLEAGGIVTMPIECAFASENITLYQFDLYLPDGVTLAKNDKGRFAAGTTYVLSNRHDEHTASLKENTAGFVRFVVSQNDCYTIAPGSGELLTLYLQVDASVTGNLQGFIKNFMMFETDETKHEMNDITFALNEAIQYSEVYYLYNTDADLFLSKGNSYGTHAVLGEDALPVRIGTSGSHTYLYIDNADDTKTLLYRENGGDDSQIYVDGNGLGSGRQYFWIITADSNGTLVIKAEDHAGEALYLGNIPTRDDYDYQNETSLDAHVDIVSNATESDNIHWMLLPEKLIKRLDSGSALNGDLNGDGDVDILDATIIVYRQLGRE